jgi:type IV secretory pathway VirB10-like protein
MRKISSFVCALFIAACFGLQTASAQFPGGLKIPKIPKRDKAHPAPTPAEAARPTPSEEATPTAQPQPVAPAATTPAPAARPQASGPKVITTRVQFRARTVSSYKGTLGVWSWVPEIKFDTEGRCRAARTTTSRSRSPAAARG